MSSPLTITLNKPYIDSVKEIFSEPNDIFKTVGSRFNINKIESSGTRYEQNNGNGNDNDIYSYTMVILKQDSEGTIDIAIICQFNKNILGGEEYNYSLDNDTICQVIYNETDKNKNKGKEYYIYRPDNNYGVGNLLKTRYDTKKSNNDVLFKVFIIKGVPIMKGDIYFTITIDGDKIATIDRFDIVKKDVSPATPATSSDLNKLDKSLFLLLYYINFHSFNVRFFSQLNNKFFGMTTGGITTAEPLQPSPKQQKKTPVEPQPESQQKTPVKQRSERIRKAITTTYPITGIGSNEKEEVVAEEPGKEEAEAEAKRIKAEAEAKINKAEAEAKINKAEAEAKINKAEAEAKINKAEAERNKVEAEAEAKRKKAEAEKKAEKEAEENNYKLEDIVDNEKDDDPFDPNIYNKATKKLIKYLFKKYKGTSEQKFSNLLEFHKDKTITKNNFIDLFLDKTSKEYAERWFNAEFPNKDNKDNIYKDKLLDAIKKYRYKVIYNKVAGEKKKEEEYKKKQLELEAKRKEEELQKKTRRRELQKKQEEEAAKKAAEEAAKKAAEEAAKKAVK
jgi:hypothetical protein